MNVRYKILVVVLLSLLFINATPAQQLSNTTWMAYRFITNTFTNYVSFSDSVISYSTDNVNYTACCTYSEAGDTVQMVQSGFTICFGHDTGLYYIQIYDDTLGFSIVSDSCASRQNYYTGRYFIRLTTDINSSPMHSDLLVYPNPFNDKLNFKSDYENIDLMISDITAKILLNQSLSSHSSIDTDKFASGIYFYEARTKGKLLGRGKIIKN